ncbi:hypothetical protein J6590_035869 [Homalodisca vitripennis]|nr:hypothetical protein J6590_035869 [Homalodisca vitripennis]
MTLVCEHVLRQEAKSPLKLQVINTSHISSVSTNSVPAHIAPPPPPLYQPSTATPCRITWLLSSLHRVLLDAWFSVKKCHNITRPFCISWMRKAWRNDRA